MLMSNVDVFCMYYFHLCIIEQGFKIKGVLFCFDHSLCRKAVALFLTSSTTVVAPRLRGYYHVCTSKQYPYLWPIEIGSICLPAKLNPASPKRISTTCIHFLVQHALHDITSIIFLDLAIHFLQQQCISLPSSPSSP